MSRHTYNLLGFDVRDSDWIHLNDGCFRPRANMMSIVGEQAVFKEVFFFGSNIDFNKMLDNLVKKSKEEKAYFVGYILTAQNSWSERDQLIFDALFDYSDLHRIIKSSLRILNNISDMKARHHNRKLTLKSRKTGFPIATGTKTTPEKVFVEDVSTMLSYLSKATDENIDVYLKLKELTAKELLETKFFKD